MAEGITAKFTYETDEGKTASVSLKYAATDVESADMLAAGQAFITNNAIFENKYATLKSAKIVEITETEFVN